MNRRETLSLSGSIEPSKLMVSQGEVIVSPLHIGTGALEHLCQIFGLLHELALFGRAQLFPDHENSKRPRRVPRAQRQRARVHRVVRREPGARCHHDR